MKWSSFEELEVYQACREFRKEVSKIARKCFPPSEKFLLTAQILDSSRSVTANIAEGYGRFYYKENIKFCRISRGSLTETFEHLICAFDEGYITKAILDEKRPQYIRCLQLINGYIAYLQRQKGKE